MHFPSVVHLAPRRNDLFDVYSRSLTLIKITAGPSFASLFLSLSLSRFFGVLSLVSPPSFFVLPFVVPKDSPRGWERSHHQDFRFLPRVRVRLKEILALISRAEARIQGVPEITVRK